MQLLAQEFSVVIKSPDPAKLYCYSPGLTRLPTGRLVATMDFGGPGVAGLPGIHGDWRGIPVQGKAFISDDGGASWRHCTDFPFLHARPFVAGKSLYVLGHCGDVMAIRSDDGGETWTPPAKLTDGGDWAQAPCNVHYANGCIYLVMEQGMPRGIRGWAVASLAPVLMRARLGDDLTRRESWTFASSSPFVDLVDAAKGEGFGVPFFATNPNDSAYPAPGREMAPTGWLECNVVQFVDPDHLWCDPSGRTFHLWLRAHTGGTGYACMVKAVEQGEVAGTGEIVTMLERVPSGRSMLFVPCPGGQMKFHLLYDEPTRLYWLLSTQATDSMRRIERLPPNRYNLPNNERRRLQLHFSRNMIDWCFAGLVATGPVEHASRHYASMVIDGEDLCVLSRSGDQQAASAHNGNLITFHRVRQFRKLVY